MEPIAEKSEDMEAKKDGIIKNDGGVEIFIHGKETECEDSSPSPSMGWPVMLHSDNSHVSGKVEMLHLDNNKSEKQQSSLPETEMLKERFAKLLLGEDMSGSGNGVSTALAVSNAITNLCATLFGQIWRLEPLPVEKKLKWRRELEWLLCVSDNIMELVPSWQTFPDGSKLEVMNSRQRLDLYINLPALRKLDNLLIEILDSFRNNEFWYVDQGIIAPEADRTCTSGRAAPRQQDKWWLPVPRVPTCGLSGAARKDLQHLRDCTNQILKAAMAINSNTLAEMEVPESYLETLPKNAKSSLYDLINRHSSSDQFSPECLLDCLNISSEHQALEIANRVEASIYACQQRTLSNTNQSNPKSSWAIVKDFIDAGKREQLLDKAERLLLRLKQRFPGLPQTNLDMSKILHNKDVGKSILESYSRVLESLAFNIVARIDDVLYVDDLIKHSGMGSISKVGMVARKSLGVPVSMTVPGTPCHTAFTTPTFSPARRVSPAKEERSPFLDKKKNTQRGLGARRILTDYLTIEPKVEDFSNENKKSDALSNSRGEISAS